MNNIRAIEALNQRELEAGIPLSASWHTDWSDTAYIYIGGLPFELSEGDIITIFSQFGEPVHVNLIRDKDTGKSKGFAFLKYEDQRSTNLAVDNLGGATILGRTIRIDHTRYKPKEGDMVDENAYANSRGKAKGDDGDDDEVRYKRRRGRNDDDLEDGGDRRERTPPQEILKEELELQELIREHDEEDPMKEFLIREKKVEVQKALKRFKRDKKLSKHRHYSEKDSKSEHKHRSYRHRSRSKEPSRRHRSRSTSHRYTTGSPDETNLSRDKGKDREEKVSDKNRTRDRNMWREMERESGRGWDEQKGRGNGAMGGNVNRRGIWIKRRVDITTGVVEQRSLEGRDMGKKSEFLNSNISK